MMLVGLAVGICLLATFASVSLVEHARLSGDRSRRWLAVAALAGGTGIWATHFIAMLAFNAGMPCGYNLVLTVASLFSAILFSGSGFSLARDATNWRRPALGGALLGLGIGAMHYGGMAAFDVPGRLSWDGGIVAMSILLGMGLGAIALVVGAAPGLGRRALSAVLLAAAIASLHFTAMGALTIHADPTLSVPVTTVAAPLMAVPVALASGLILVLAVIALKADIVRHAAAEATRMRSLAEAAVEGLFICDRTVIVVGNSYFAGLAGVEPAALPGLPLARCLPDRSIVDAILLTPDRPIETPLTTLGGEAIPVEIIAHPIEFAGRPHHAVAVRDLRARRLAEERINFLAHHDLLTGLPNRALFEARLDDAIETALRRRRGLAVLCLDLDRLKEINDLFGHQAGDEVLTAMGQTLANLPRGAETAARLGGDEFAVILPEADAEEAGAVAANILQRLSQLDAARSGEPGIATSLGIALFPADGEDRRSLLAAADTALYQAKAAGRRTFRFYESGMGLQLRDRRRLEHDLRSAVDLGEMSLVYQPQVAVTSGTLVGFEALLRWCHPERGFVSPGVFIPIAEESGAIAGIGEWVLRTACAEAATWANPLRVAVNVSAVQLHAAGFASFITRVIDETGIAPDRLEIEITETALIRDFDRALATLRQLKGLGVKIAMDDFGTGYSSLSNLRAFPFDRIKIDGSFIQSVDSNSQAAAIVRAILELGRGLDLPIVAEGVETDAELRFLRSELCQEVQGYLLGRPAAIETFAPFTGRSETAEDRDALAA